MLSTHNVPGALSSSSRRDFKAVLEAFADAEVPMPGSGRWQTPGWYEAEALTSLGACTTPNISEQHSGAGASFLSQILEANAPARYSLSPKACQGILRQAERRGKDLPPMLKTALEQQARG